MPSRSSRTFDPSELEMDSSMDHHRNDHHDKVRHSPKLQSGEGIVDSGQMHDEELAQTLDPYMQGHQGSTSIFGHSTSDQELINNLSLSIGAQSSLNMPSLSLDKMDGSNPQHDHHEESSRADLPGISGAMSVMTGLNGDSNNGDSDESKLNLKSDPRNREENSSKMDLHDVLKPHYPRFTPSTRRGRCKWTEEETAYLVHGCRQHGVGNWKKILEDSNYNFSDRTAVDLKDRFRTSFPQDYARLYPNARTHKQKVEVDPGNPNRLVKVNRKERRAFTLEEDQLLLQGFLKHGASWCKIQRDKTLGLHDRRSTDLRDRFRNAFPDRYMAAGYKGRTSSKQPKWEPRMASETVRAADLGPVPDQSFRASDVNQDSNSSRVQSNRLTHSILMDNDTPIATQLPPLNGNRFDSIQAQIGPPSSTSSPSSSIPALQQLGMPYYFPQAHNGLQNDVFRGEH